MQPDLPLRDRRILITRAREDGSALGSLLEGLGATVVELPTLAIQPPEDYAPLDAALRNLPHYDWVAFASRNAVRAVFDRLPALSLPATLPVGLCVAAVGPSTASALNSRGVVPDCVPERATASELAAAMIRDGIEGARIFLPAGNLTRPELRRELEDAGADVEGVVAYRTVRPNEIDTSALDGLRKGAVDVVALASPSAVRNLVDMLRGDTACLQHSALACIGPSTAEAVQALGLSPAVVATSHTLVGLAEAIVDCSGERMYGSA